MVASRIVVMNVGQMPRKAGGGASCTIGEPAHLRTSVAHQLDCSEFGLWGQITDCSPRQDLNTLESRRLQRAVGSTSLIKGPCRWYALDWYRVLGETKVPVAEPVPLLGIPGEARTLSLHSPLLGQASSSPI